MQQPLISVIIPCYNHGKYLPAAIDSILLQSYKNYEIIVVDDGSVDNTKEVAERYSFIKYIYQPNQGLSASRNKGIENSLGELLVFLDADDWLVPHAFDINLHYLKANDKVAFVSGAHEILYEGEKTAALIQRPVDKEHYCHLLEHNYIGMHAAVLFRRWVFDLFRYDVTLKSCEDYDLYLKIVRNYPIISHTELIAVYRFHDSNMSRNYLVMLESALFVLAKQKDLLRNETEKQWYNKGTFFWKDYYSGKMYHQLVSLLNQRKNLNEQEISALKRYNDALYRKFVRIRRFTLLNRPVIKIKNMAKRFLPGVILNRLRKSPLPAPGKVNLGDLNRTQPFSTQFGYDRGGPVDRYYIENFLQQNASAISGRVLEIGDNEYTLHYGGSNVVQSDILHVDETNEKATFIGDLSNAPQLPDNSFDCIVLTQTLHLIYNYQGAIETCFRTLKPGGKLLLTVPGISHVAQDEWGKYWLWAFTDVSIKRILTECFSPEKVAIHTFGNVLVAAAFLYGMGLPELTKAKLDDQDPHYQVIITASATKQAENV